eukprot:CAMPEP_0184305032 /NCGR_PEP_ID=MMETSP1049-20130417/14406_1 /TAXON_ID=77928 /ORGANISM="Proteomonas sulcata, Strain CCMP704" /LENGTH=457 /DNA_ID=CAMNT_0026617003 /DNA_START=115 /DNA_END=1488 /DNA_ORIENTATION=+
MTAGSTSEGAEGQRQAWSEQIESESLIERILPEELLSRSLAHLDWISLCHISAVSRRFRRRGAGSDLWFRICQEEWNQRQLHFHITQRILPSILGGSPDFDEYALLRRNTKAHDVQGCEEVKDSPAEGAERVPGVLGAERSREKEVDWKAAFRAVYLDRTRTRITAEETKGMRWCFRFTAQAGGHSSQPVPLVIFTDSLVDSNEDDGEKEGGALLLPGYPALPWHIQGEEEVGSGSRVVIANFPPHWVKRTADWGFIIGNENVLFWTHDVRLTESSNVLMELGDTLFKKEDYRGARESYHAALNKLGGAMTSEQVKAFEALDVYAKVDDVESPWGRLPPQAIHMRAQVLSNISATNTLLARVVSAQQLVEGQLPDLDLDMMKLSTVESLYKEALAFAWEVIVLTCDNGVFPVVSPSLNQSCLRRWREAHDKLENLCRAISRSRLLLERLQGTVHSLA